MQAETLNDLLAGYTPRSGVADELFAAPGQLRPVWQPLIDHMAALGPDVLAQRFARGDQYLADAGVYFRQHTATGSDERSWPLSHVPVVIAEQEWRALSDGIVQRAELLERVMADLYGPGRLVSDGLLPAELVAQNSEWLRPVVGTRPPSGHFLHFLAFEIGRSPDGSWFVLGDRTQAPSGAGFALENRMATSRVFFDHFSGSNVERLAGFFRAFRDAANGLRHDGQGRVAILRVHLEKVKLAPDLPVEDLAALTPGFTGADLANLVNEAALLAARDGKDAVEMIDFERAIDRVIGGLEKKNKLISPEEKKIVAYHEAGHAVAGWFREYTDPVVKVSIVPRGMAALGYAQSLPQERYLYTKEALVDRMVMTMGGRVAEEIIFGQITTGAQNDLEKITKMAYAMVVDYGMSEEIGYVSFNMSGQKDQPVFDKPFSDDMARRIDAEVKALIDDVRAQTRVLLEERADDLERLAQALLEKEVLNENDLREVLGDARREVGRGGQRRPRVPGRRPLDAERGEDRLATGEGSVEDLPVEHVASHHLVRRRAVEGRRRADERADVVSPFPGEAAQPPAASAGRAEHEEGHGW